MGTLRRHAGSGNLELLGGARITRRPTPLGLDSRLPFGLDILEFPWNFSSESGIVNELRGFRGDKLFSCSLLPCFTESSTHKSTAAPFSIPSFS